MPADDISFEVHGNEAWLKYKAAEPLSADELAVVANIDLDIWEMVEQQPNVWTMGRKDKRVAIEWVDGLATGFVDDSGKLYKTYMYQMKAKFVRKVPIAINPVLRPVEIISKTRGRKRGPKKDKGLTRILFITDPHFGFATPLFEKPVTFHSRRFLSDLLVLILSLDTDILVWGGDTLDLAGFSRWPKKPEIIHNTQIAAIEAGWVINRFGLIIPQQEHVEGNHCIRLPNATAENMSEAYGLKPITDMEGPELISVPRLLGFDKNPNYGWHSGYPDSFWEYGDVRFEHGGPAAPNQSGATVTKLLKEIGKTTIFGHIHRPERAEKNARDQEGPIIAATPGCACRKETTPGAGLKRNWGIGAFYLTFRDERLVSLEPIQHHNNETYFRGERWEGEDYNLAMEKDIPEKYMLAL